MRDTHIQHGMACPSDGQGALAPFAARVLDALVDRSRRTSSTLRTDLVAALAQGMLAPEAQVDTAIAGFRRACISPESMADIYIPESARRLGADWAVDRLGFAEVTMAVARLQVMVRAIGTRWGGDAAHVPGRKSVLMVVPDGEDHTLGAVVAAGQLRRMGLSVCLRLGPGRQEVIDLLRTRSFDAAFVSVGHVERLDQPRRLVETIRTFGPRRLPVIGGGALPLESAEAAARIGVDRFTCDLGDAVRACGLLPEPIEVSHVPMAMAV